MTPTIDRFIGKTSEYEKRNFDWVFKPELPRSSAMENNKRYQKKRKK